MPDYSFDKPLRAMNMMKGYRNRLDRLDRGSSEWKALNTKYGQVQDAVLDEWNSAEAFARAYQNALGTGQRTGSTVPKPGTKPQTRPYDAPGSQYAPATTENLPGAAGAGNRQPPRPGTKPSPSTLGTPFQVEQGIPFLRKGQTLGGINIDAGDFQIGDLEQDPRQRGRQASQRSSDQLVPDWFPKPMPRQSGGASSRFATQTQRSPNVQADADSNYTSPMRPGMGGDADREPGGIASTVAPTQNNSRPARQTPSSSAPNPTTSGSGGSADGGGGYNLRPGGTGRAGPASMPDDDMPFGSQSGGGSSGGSIPDQYEEYLSSYADKVDQLRKQAENAGPTIWDALLAFGSAAGSSQNPAQQLSAGFQAVGQAVDRSQERQRQLQSAITEAELAGDQARLNLLKYQQEQEMAQQRAAQEQQNFLIKEARKRREAAADQGISVSDRADTMKDFASEARKIMDPGNSDLVAAMLQNNKKPGQVTQQDRRAALDMLTKTYGRIPGYAPSDFTPLVKQYMGNTDAPPTVNDLSADALSR